MTLLNHKYVYLRIICRSKTYTLKYNVRTLSLYNEAMAKKSTKVTAAKPRLLDLDFMRVMATLAVIAIHSSAALVLNRPVTDKTWLIGNFVDSFARWSVPLFVIISGALLINGKALAAPRLFLQRRLTRILVPLAAWIIIYAALAVFVWGDPFNFGMIMFNIVAGNPAPGHLYFLLLIAGLYVITPLIALVVQNISRRTLWRSTIAILVFTCAWHALEVFVLRGGPPLNILTQWVPYVGYYMLGYLLHTSTPRSSTKQLALGFFGGGLAIALISYLMTRWLGTGLGLYFYNFPTPLVAIVSVAAFLGGKQVYAALYQHISKKHRPIFERRLTQLSAATFGIYLVHIAIITTLAMYLPLRGATVAGLLILLIVVPPVSYTLTLIIGKIPYVRRIMP